MWFWGRVRVRVRESYVVYMGVELGGWGCLFCMYVFMVFYECVVMWLNYSVMGEVMFLFVVEKYIF